MCSIAEVEVEAGVAKGEGGGGGGGRAWHLGEEEDRKEEGERKNGKIVSDKREIDGPTGIPRSAQEAPPRRLRPARPTERLDRARG